MTNLIDILEHIDQTKTTQELTELFNASHARWTRQLTAKDMKVIRAHALRRWRQLIDTKHAA
jgi:hypothetical protein